MSSDAAISIRGLSKAYKIQHNAVRHTRLAEVMLERLRHPFRRAQTETFWALRDIELDIAQGEALGIVGHNGAGKSTLLKVISRITPPTTGQIDLRGRVGSLLEVGTGFHPELSGRENIYLNGSILGMTRAEIKRHFDAIVEFAGVEQFLDTPVKRYSSGMYVRLAFAVAAHLEPEILVVDEVLAVGDVEFQKKCLGKMQNVAGHGRTVLFISHNMAAIQALCSRVIVLDKGGVVYDGSPDEACEMYTRMLSHGGGENGTLAQVQGKGFELRDIRIEQPEGAPPAPLKPLNIRVPVMFEAPCTDPWVHLFVQTPQGETIFAFGSWEMGQQRFDAASQFEFNFQIKQLPLLPGTYRLMVNIGSYELRVDQFVELGNSLDVAEAPVYGSIPTTRKLHGLVPVEATLDVTSPVAHA